MGQWQPGFHDIKKFLDESGYKKKHSDQKLLDDIKEHIQQKYDIVPNRAIIMDYIKIWRALKKE